MLLWLFSIRHWCYQILLLVTALIRKQDSENKTQFYLFYSTPVNTLKIAAHNPQTDEFNFNLGF